MEELRTGRMKNLCTSYRNGDEGWVFCRRLACSERCKWQESCAIMSIPLGETRKSPMTEEL